MKRFFLANSFSFMDIIVLSMLAPLLITLMGYWAIIPVLILFAASEVTKEKVNGN